MNPCYILFLLAKNEMNTCSVDLFFGKIRYIDFNKNQWWDVLYSL